MKKKLLSAILLALTTLAMHASDSTTVRRTVYFDTDISTLTDSARSSLDVLAASLRDAGEYSIYIYGAADVDGGEQYNQQLSERRARSVRDYLLARSLRARECTSRGLGRQGDLQSKAENRRVDIEIRLTRYSSIDDLTSALSAGTDQYYTIDPSREQEIKCKDGAKIRIPAGAFRGADGRPVSGPVRITVREALSMADFLTQDLSAVSDGRMLESRGMMQITATAGGRDVMLGTPVQIALPAMDNKSDMKLFYGQRTADNKMNWKVTDEKFEKPDPTVPLTLDRASLRQAEIRNRFYPEQPQFAAVKLPVEPVLPRAPQTVKKPVEGKPLYKASRSERLFHPRRVAAQNQKLYDEAMKKYNDYINKKTAYDQKKQEIADAQIRYVEEQKAFLAEGERRMAVAKQYIRKLYCYHASGEINAKLKELEVLPVTNKTNFAIISAEHLNEPQNQKEILRQILGDTYFRYFGFDTYGTGMSELSVHESNAAAFHFHLDRYDQVYDSMYTAHHIYDTLRRMQTQLIQKCADMGLLNNRNMDGYVASINQLGWINCDRFLSSPASQVADIRVNEPNPARVYMVFRSENSLTQMEKTAGGYVSTKVPKGRQVSIVSIRLDGGKPQIAVAKINTSRRDPVNLTYKTCTLDEMRAQFSAVQTGS
ncbi:MAG: OmpA family protein [Bacteroidetes bacterium]|nr:OmpA family protein [Bacteroidota bacterium]